MAKSIDILFKQTTSERIKCKFCSSTVDGEDGYIKININLVYARWGATSDRRIVICNNCFKHLTDRITKAKENKKESYNKLVKTKVLKSLE